VLVQERKQGREKSGATVTRARPEATDDKEEKSDGEMEGSDKGGEDEADRASLSR